MWPLHTPRFQPCVGELIALALLCVQHCLLGLTVIRFCDVGCCRILPLPLVCHMAGRRKEGRRDYCKVCRAVLVLPISVRACSPASAANAPVQQFGIRLNPVASPQASARRVLSRAAALQSAPRRGPLRKNVLCCYSATARHPCAPFFCWSSTGQDCSKYGGWNEPWRAITAQRYAASPSALRACCAGRIRASLPRVVPGWALVDRQSSVAQDATARRPRTRR